MSRILKLLPTKESMPSSEARTQLAEKIQTYTEMLDTLAGHRTTSDRLREEVWAADRAIERAQAKLSEVRETTVRHMAFPSTAAPEMDVTAAEKAIDRAQDQYNQVRNAHELVKEAIEELEKSIVFKASYVKDAVRAELRTSDEVRSLYALYLDWQRRTVEIEHILCFLSSRDCLPREFKLERKSWPATSDLDAWKAAYEGLLVDASTPLPKVIAP